MCAIGHLSLEMGLDERVGGEAGAAFRLQPRGAGQLVANHHRPMPPIPVPQPRGSVREEDITGTNRPALEGRGLVVGSRHGHAGPGACRARLGYEPLIKSRTHPTEFLTRLPEK